MQFFFFTRVHLVGRYNEVLSMSSNRPTTPNFDNFTNSSPNQNPPDSQSFPNPPSSLFPGVPSFISSASTHVPVPVFEDDFPDVPDLPSFGAVDLPPVPRHEHDPRFDQDRMQRLREEQQMLEKQIQEQHNLRQQLEQQKIIMERLNQQIYEQKVQEQRLQEQFRMEQELRNNNSSPSSQFTPNQSSSPSSFPTAPANSNSYPSPQPPFQSSPFQSQPSSLSTSLSDSNYIPSDEVVLNATKQAKCILSALQFDDVPTAVKYIKICLTLLTGQPH